ncbi:pyrophosphate--fructose-6-phosphate 1-phosphotransferase [Brachybacterium huguangmaarense]|uniref:Pyrophosphate--fructose 6-phosphate 1-phosphotransferase n=1 Tax=Brachybacterium huguangmaarense TaxID=1652028 RepID=A0ABY6FYE0_9MICO|nr:pyrophosphate--fructose-6-phosphate 1-phosphotransferase [Brachybacterium huguangmaarense]UYG15940.1 pyrophosphate--fructose-6-phosphate 1-phosphotransferase [Brachybacterium huguangmaarense]
MTVKRVALLTAGGYAPCLSSAVGGLVERYTALVPDVEIIAYRHGYWGLLSGEKIVVDDVVREKAHLLHDFGGSPIGNSRVKLTNTADLVKRGLIQEGEDALEVAADKLKEDGVDVLHTIGGDDTNTTAADLAQYLHDNGYELQVVGLPKTIDNDIVPIRQSLGAMTAAEQTSIFAQNVIAEHGSNPRMLIVHEIMGRACGYLTAQAAEYYQQWHDRQEWLPEIGLSGEKWDVHAVFLPEMALDIDAEAERLKSIMDTHDCVNIFLSEGAGIPEIVAEMQSRGEEPEMDPFGHVKLDTINPGQWFAKQFAEKLGAEKVMVQKSGYFARSAKANQADLRLIQSMTDLAVQVALEGGTGVIGHDEERGDVLRAVEFDRIAGHKAFDISQPWFQKVMERVGQKIEPAAQH